MESMKMVDSEYTYIECGKNSYGDCFQSKILPLKARVPKFDSQNPHKKARHCDTYW